MHPARQQTNTSAWKWSQTPHKITNLIDRKIEFIPWWGMMYDFGPNPWSIVWASVFWQGFWAVSWPQSPKSVVGLSPSGARNPRVYCIESWFRFKGPFRVSGERQEIQRLLGCVCVSHIWMNLGHEFDAHFIDRLPLLDSPPREIKFHINGARLILGTVDRSFHEVSLEIYSLKIPIVILI